MRGVQSIKRQTEAKEADYNLAKYRNVVGSIISKSSNLDKVTRISHVFTLWKNYTYDRKRAVLGLVSLIKKSHDQVAFDAIRDTDWIVRRREHRKKILTKTIKQWLYRKQTVAINKWKQVLFEIAT